MKHASGLIESESKNIELSTADSNAHRRTCADVINNNGTKESRGRTWGQRLSGIHRESYSFHYIDTSAVLYFDQRRNACSTYDTQSRSLCPPATHCNSTASLTTLGSQWAR